MTPYRKWLLWFKLPKFEQPSELKIRVSGSADQGDKKHCFGQKAKTKNNQKKPTNYRQKLTQKQPSQNSWVPTTKNSPRVDVLAFCRREGFLLFKTRVVSAIIFSIRGI